MSDEPKQLRGARRCGAKTRSGKPCRSPAVGGRPRCRMHGCGRGSGGPCGERNGNFKHGRYTQETKELRKMVRQMTREAETNLATALSTLGVKKKRSTRRRPDSEVEMALAEILASGQPVPNPFETIAQIIGKAVRSEDAKPKPDAAITESAGELPDAPPF
jgi:hypothetical protein